MDIRSSGLNWNSDAENSKKTLESYTKGHRNLGNQGHCTRDSSIDSLGSDNDYGSTNRKSCFEKSVKPSETPCFNKFITASCLKTVKNFKKLCFFNFALI